MRDSREKGAGMRAGSGPPFPDLSFPEGIQSSLRCKRFRVISKQRPRNDEERTVLAARKMTPPPPHISSGL